MQSASRVEQACCLQPPLVNVPAAALLCAAPTGERHITQTSSFHSATWHSRRRVHARAMHAPCMAHSLRYTVAGWGNRLTSVVTGAILALLTNRTLLVRLDKVRGDPGWFELGELLELCFPWSYNRSVHDKHLVGASEEVLTLAWTKLLEHDWLSHESRLGGPDVLLYQSNDYQVPLLQSNPFLASFFSTHFPTGEVYTHLWRRLFQPSPSLASHLEQLRAQHVLRRSHQHLVGIQIRVLKGTQAHFNGFDLSHFFQMAEAAARSRGHTGSSVLYFIASDEAHVYKRAAEYLGSNRTFWTDNKIETSLQGSDHTNPGTELTGISDVFLLSMCDDIVTSFSSTFGGLAAAMAGIKPVMVFPEASLPKQMVFPKYFRAIYSEPCMWGANELLIDAANAQQKKVLMSNSFFLHHLQCHWYDTRWPVYSSGKGFFSSILGYLG